MRVLAILLSGVVVLSGCASSAGVNGAATAPAVTLTATTTPTAGPPSDTTPPPTRPPAPVAADILTDGLQSLLDTSGASGGIAAYWRPEGAPVVVTAGSVDATGAPVPTDRPFPVASVTKSFTAALLVGLAAEGRLDLDAPIATWLEWPAGDRITVRELLTHTSGIGPWGPTTDGTSPFDAALFADLAANHPLAEVIELARDVGTVGPPGAQTFYSNLNYVLAGRIAELVGGAPFARLLAERISVPLGLTGTSYPAGLEPTTGADPLPGTFEFPEGTIVSSTDFPQAGFVSLMGPSAAMTSTVADLLTWGEVLFRSRRLGELDLAPLLEIGGGGYGLGVIGIDEEYGSCVFTVCPGGVEPEYLGLNGEVPGSAVRLWYDPTNDALLLIYLNRNGADLDHPLVELVGRLRSST